MSAAPTASPAAAPFGRVAVVGAGAVGSFFGALLARAGHRVTLVARPAHVAAVERDGVQIDWADGRHEAIPVAASSALESARGADLVLLCVKSTDTEATARALAPLLDPGALVLCLQNGVENAAIAARHLACPVVPAVVYVATEMPAPGVVKHHGRGDLVIGPRQASEADLVPRLERVAAAFSAAGVPVKVSLDVMAALWSKLMLNCAYNAISGLAQSSYGEMAALPPIVELQREVVREVCAVAAAESVDLPLAASLSAMEKLVATMPNQHSSTAQDMARGKPSEIDHLNGFVARRGRELGVATPLNHALWALVKLWEARHVGAAAAR